MKPAPMSVRDALGPVRVRVHGGPVLAELVGRFGGAAAAKVRAGDVVDADGAVVDDATVLPAGASVYLYRDLPDEVPVPFDVPVRLQSAEITGPQGPCWAPRTAPSSNGPNGVRASPPAASG